MENSLVFHKKRHSPLLISQPQKTTEKTQLYHFKSKLLFENLMHISPQDIEEALNIQDPNLKLPSFLELLDLKIRIQTEEQKLKEILPYGLHSGQAWNVSKYLSFLYLICANIFLTRNIYQKFSLFYLKALHIIDPPAKDCSWETKPEWQILKVIAGTHISLFYCKNEKLNKSIETLISLNDLLRSLEGCVCTSKVLYHIYASLGLLFYRINDIGKSRKYLEKAVFQLTRFLKNSHAIKKPAEKDLIEQYEEEKKNMEYSKLINLYLNYKICKINFQIKEKEAALVKLMESFELIKQYEKELRLVENKEAILSYVYNKLKNVQKNLQEDLHKGLLEDLNELAKETPSESLFSNKEVEVEKNKEKQRRKSYKIQEPGEKRNSIKPHKIESSEQQKETFLYRIRKTKSIMNQNVTLNKNDDQEIKNNNKEEIKELQKLRKEKSKQIKSAYKFHDFRQDTVQIKSQTSYFTFIQKPLEKYAKVYEILGRPLFIRKKHNSNSIKADNSHTNSTTSNFNTSNSTKNRENARKNGDVSQDFLKKLSNISNKIDKRGQETEENEKNTQKEIIPKKSLKSVLLQTNELAIAKKAKTNDKIERITINPTWNKQMSLKNRPENPISRFQIDELFDESYISFENEKNTLKTETDIADEAIRQFFKQKELSLVPKNENQIDSLNTIKSSGDFDEDGKSSNAFLKESYRFETSSKLKNESDKLIATPNKDLMSANIRSHYPVFTFEVANNENTQKAAKYIQKRFRAFMKSKQKKEKEQRSPETKSPSPSFQRAFKKYHTLTSIAIQQAFHNIGKETDNNESEFRRKPKNKNEISPQKRHRSYIYNLKDLLMKRRQIKITIHKNFFLFTNKKPSHPKIHISSSNFKLKSAISQKFSRNSEEFPKSSGEPREKLHLNLIHTDKSLENISQLEDSNAISQIHSPKMSEIKENQGSLSPKSFQNISEMPSASELKDSMKELEENASLMKKSTLNIMTVNNMKHKMKEFKSHIQENKKKFEGKSDFNQLNYEPFFFTKFFAGRLRKFRVKYFKFQGKDQEKRIIFYLQSKQWNYKFECPATRDVKMKAFKDFRTIWPLVFQPFYEWMQNNSFLTEEDFKNEHKFMSERIRARISFFDRSHQRKNHLSETANDIKACGDTKILLEILLTNYFVSVTKLNGDALKFIGSDLKESIVNSYSHILFSLRKMKQELKKFHIFGSFYEKKCEKKLLEDLQSQKNSCKYQQIYSENVLKNIKIMLNSKSRQNLINKDLVYYFHLKKQYENTKTFYNKELVLLLQSLLNCRSIVSQFVKKDLFNNLFWIVAVTISGVVTHVSESQLSIRNSKKSLLDSIDLMFVIKIYNNKYKKSHVNQETMGVRNFEKQLEGKIITKKLLKTLLMNDRFSLAYKKIIRESLVNDLSILDSKIKLKHRGELSAINEQEFFQLNIEKKINTISKNTMLFTKRKAQVTDPITELFDNVFVEIYNKDFIHKREENFDTFYEKDEQTSNEIDEDLQDIKKIGQKYSSKYGHLEIIQEDEVELRKNEEIHLSSENFDRFEKDIFTFPSINQLNQTFFLKLRSKENNYLIFVKIILENILNETRLFLRIFSPIQRIISYGTIEDKKLITILMKIVETSQPQLKTIKIANILQRQSRVHGFNYTFYNKKKEKESGISKKTLLFSREISVKSHLIKNSEDLLMKFKRKTLHFLIRLPKIGKVNVSMNVYFYDDLLETFQEYSILICFQINYYNSRTKALKLILNRDDLHERFGFDSRKVLTTLNFLNKMRELLQNISFIRQKLYTSPQYIPKNRGIISPRATETSSFLQSERKTINKKWQKDLEMLRLFRNNFAKHDLGKTQTNITKGFLEEYIQDTRIIGQFIKRIRNEYLLVTVCKHMILDYWVLYNYIPKTSRYFVCYITNSDLLYMDIKDISEIYPSQIHNDCVATSQKRAFLNYRSFTKKYKRILQSSEADYAALERKTSFQLGQLAKFQGEGQSTEGKEREIGAIVDSFKNRKLKKVMKIKTITDITEKMNAATRKGLSHERYKNLYNFIEIFLWENFVKRLELKCMGDFSWIFYIKKFKVQLKQMLFTNYVKIDKYNDAYIDIFILLNKEKDKKKRENETFDAELGKDRFKSKETVEKVSENPRKASELGKTNEKIPLFLPFEPIGYAATSNHNIVIRYLSLNKLSIQFEKINLREIINLFIADGFYKFQTNYMNSKFYLSDLQNLCNFIIYKIKSSNFANLIHDSTSKKKHHASKNTHYFNRMVENEDSSETPVVKQIFNRKPLQIITFKFLLESRVLNANIYKKSSCQSITREYKFEALNEIIPFFSQMLQNEMYKEICERLLTIIRNILTIDVNFEFMLLDKNEE